MQGDTARLAVTGELDIATVPRLEEAVATVLAQGTRSLIVDLSRLAFVDSSGLRMFITLNDRASAEGWSLGLIRPPDPSYSVFQITGAEENLPFIEDPSP
ncbi:MAG: anti-sigma-factor antagonist [Solirubrobacterales bacterium]|jgi:anti-anti-sigma factor|nr:anti-sigma-factor antagonist [Solirubrobacterales bacterium]